jgi:hypothetical protein
VPAASAWYRRIRIGARQHQRAAADLRGAAGAADRAENAMLVSAPTCALDDPGNRNRRSCLTESGLGYGGRGGLRGANLPAARGRTQAVFSSGGTGADPGGFQRSHADQTARAPRRQLRLAKRALPSFVTPFSCILVSLEQ